MRLIIGLGNPGREYAGTRHNVGFETVDRLAWRLGWIDRPEQFDRLARSKFDGLAMDGIFSTPDGQTHRLLLLKPMTYMNLSGRSVRTAMTFYQATAEQIMIVLDDLALPAGKIRIRSGGSSGGHNGLKDIQRALGIDAYPRLRIGIDPAPPPVAGKDYVLGRFTPSQRQLLEPALDRACAAIGMWIEKGIGPAMSRFNADAENES